MNTHYGDIIERTIRRNGYSISELARVLNVNRRTIYNWFLQRNLKPDIIYRIGCALRHDFSEEFPHLFSKEDFAPVNQVRIVVPERKIWTEEESGMQNPREWKDKYLNLLEEYNEMLLRQVERSNSSITHNLHV